MPRTLILTILFTVLATVSIQLRAQALQVAGQLLRGKSVLEFYEAAVANPNQVILLESAIRELFAGRQNRYKELNNAIAQSFGLFQKGPLALEHLEVGPEPSQGHPHGYFSITLKKLSLKQCLSLSMNAALNSNFIRVSVNDVPLIIGGIEQPNSAPCRSQGWFEEGKNEMKYTGY